MSNRQQRRHPTHHTVPIQYPSKKRVVDMQNNGKTKITVKIKNTQKKK